MSSFIKKIGRGLQLKRDADAAKSIDSYSLFKNIKENGLSDAIRDHDLDAVAKWLQKGAHVNCKYVYMWEWSPLHIAARHEHADIANLLIAKGADVNARDGHDSTPLHCAAEMGCRDMTELLLDKGGDVNAKDAYGNTPLHIVLTPLVAELLINRGADVNAKNNDGEMPLDRPSAYAVKGLAELLKKRGAKKAKRVTVEAAKAEAGLPEDIELKQEPILEHAIIWYGESQYILTEISRSRLKEKILGSKLAWMLDINNASQVEELCSKGKTETTSMGRKKVVTLKWCKCTNPSSHKRAGVTSLS